MKKSTPIAIPKGIKLDAEKKKSLNDLGTQLLLSFDART